MECGLLRDHKAHWCGTCKRGTRQRAVRRGDHIAGGVAEDGDAAIRTAEVVQPNLQTEPNAQEEPSTLEEIRVQEIDAWEPGRTENRRRVVRLPRDFLA